MIRTDIRSCASSFIRSHQRGRGDETTAVFTDAFDCRDAYRTCFGPSIGINAGPKAIGVMYCKHEK